MEFFRDLTFPEYSLAEAKQVLGKDTVAQAYQIFPAGFYTRVVEK